MALAIITTALTELGEGFETLSPLLGAAGGAAAGIAGIVAIAAGIVKVIDEVKKEEQDKIRAANYVTRINNELRNLITAVLNKKTTTIDKAKQDLARLFYSDEMDSIDKILINYDSLTNEYLDLLNKLQTSYLNGKLLVSTDFGTVINSNANPEGAESTEKQKAQKIATELKDLGIIRTDAIKRNPFREFITFTFPYTEGVVDISQNIDMINKLNDIIPQIPGIIDYYFTQTLAILLTTGIISPTAPARLLPPAALSTPSENIDLETLTDEEIDFLIQLGLISRTRTATKSIEPDDNKNWRRKRFKPKEIRKSQIPKGKIKRISARVGSYSKWIERITFEFPERQSITSDGKGTMKFWLKSGTVIRKVRVKRGTFSVIAMWSLGSSFGTGYRYWSQFNKKAIVNREKVISWFIPLINQRDREIAIPLEINENDIKYY